MKPTFHGEGMQDDEMTLMESYYDLVRFLGTTHCRIWDEHLEQLVKYGTINQLLKRLYSVLFHSRTDRCKLLPSLHLVDDR